MGRAELRSRSESPRSCPSTSSFSPLRAAILAGQREMRRRRFVDRRNAHQAGDRRARRSSRQARRNASASSGSTPAFCGSAPVLISTNSSGLPALPGDLLGQRLAQARPVDGVDGVEQRHRLLRLVGLQRPDQVQLDAGMPRLAAPAIWPWPPAPGSRRTRAGRPRSPARSPRRRRSSTPRPASPTPGRARRRGRRARSPRARRRAAVSRRHGSCARSSKRRSLKF